VIGATSGVRRALAFLTPVGGAAEPGPSALGWFPVVGAAIGAALGCLWWGASRAWSPAVAAAIVVAGDLAATGALHFDGLVDAADGLLPPLSRARRLQVMRDPSVGAFGVAAAVVALLGRWAALAALRPSVLLLTGLWAASRAVMAVVATAVPYARADDGGLATAFLPPARRQGRGPGAGQVGAVGLAVAVGCVTAWRPLAGCAALASGVVASAALVWLAFRRLGGFTGDVLGAAGVVLETVALVVAAARW